MVRKNTYPKVIRLRTEKEFQELFRYGKRFRGHGVNVLFAHSKDLSQKRVGVVVGKKFGTAPRRNLMKRYGREVLRMGLSDIPEGLHLVLEVLPKANKNTDQEIHSAMREVLQNFIQEQRT